MFVVGFILDFTGTPFIEQLFKQDIYTLQKYQLTFSRIWRISSTFENGDFMGFLIYSFAMKNVELWRYYLGSAL